MIDRLNFKVLAITILFFASGFSIEAQNIETRLDRIIQQNYQSEKPGAAALVAKDREIIYRKAFGEANLELDVAMKPEMVFEIGSMTKQFTAMAILMLEEQGEISLQDDITKYIEDYPTHGHEITIHHLLIHTSGIKSYTSMKEWQGKWRKDFKPKEMIDFFKNEPMNFAPGEKFSYNNSAYFMLGYIIKQVSGMPYPEFLEKNIFQPLGMANSYYGSHRKIIKNRAAGYQKKSGDFVNEEFLSLTQPGAAGSIMTTVDDMWKWQQAINNNRLIKRETLEKAFTEYTLNNGEPINYGYGWFLKEIKGSPTIEHGGGIFGYTSNGIYLPEEEVYVVMLSNRDDFSPQKTSTKIAAEVIGKPYPGKEDAIEVKDSFLKSLTGVYEFEDGKTRYITYKDGRLHSQLKGSAEFPLFPVSKYRFHFEDSFSRYDFTKAKDGTVNVVMHQRDGKTKGHRSDKPLPEEENEVNVKPDILKDYVGVYELQPGFNITITYNEGQLISQATGQSKIKIYPKSKTRFFLKKVDAEIEFIRNEQDQVQSLILYQGGREMKGKRTAIDK